MYFSFLHFKKSTNKLILFIKRQVVNSKERSKRLLRSLKKDNFSNIEILNEFKIIHVFETKYIPLHQLMKQSI